MFALWISENPVPIFAPYEHFLNRMPHIPRILHHRIPNSLTSLHTFWKSNQSSYCIPAIASTMFRHFASVIILLVYLETANSAPSTIQVKSPAGELISENGLTKVLPHLTNKNLHRPRHHLSPDPKLISHNRVVNRDKVLGLPGKIRRGTTLVSVDHKPSLRTSTPSGTVVQYDSLSSSSAASKPTVSNISPASPPSMRSVPSGSVTCDSLLMKFQTMKCTWPNFSFGYYGKKVPISFGEYRGNLLMKTVVRQRFGFGFAVIAPVRTRIRFGKRQVTLKSNVTNIQTVVGFGSTPRTEVASQQNRLRRVGRRKLSAFYYPGSVAVPSGLSSCCGQTMVISALITYQLSGSGFNFEVKEFMERSAEMICEQFEACEVRFKPMSNSTYCPVCKN